MVLIKVSGKRGQGHETTLVRVHLELSTVPLLVGAHFEQRGNGPDPYPWTLTDAV
jgi:hypothetical protein